MSQLQGKRIWLTGASSGIGRALAHEMARRGATVCLTARRSDELQKLCDEIRGAGGKATPHAGDVRDLEQMKTIVGDITAHEGPIDIVVANAGTHIFTQPKDFNSQEYLDLMDLNFGGMLRCFEAVVPGMLAREKIDGTRGHLVGVASLAGFRGLPRAAAYGASKAAMIHFMESIRFHFSDVGIAVSVVNPGFVKTPLTDKNDFHMPFLIDSEKAAKIICKGIAKQKKDISFPFPFSTALRLLRVLPYPLYERIIDKAWVTNR